MKNKHYVKFCKDHKVFFETDCTLLQRTVMDAGWAPAIKIIFSL